MQTNYITTEELQKLNLKKLDKVLVIATSDKLKHHAVIMPYAYYLEMQSIIIKAHELVDEFTKNNKLELGKLKEKLNVANTYCGYCGSTHGDTHEIHCMRPKDNA